MSDLSFPMYVYTWYQSGQGHVSGIVLHYTHRAGWSNGNTRTSDREERGCAEVFIVSLINLRR